MVTLNREMKEEIIMNKESDSKRIVVLLENDAIVGYFPADCLMDRIRDWVANASMGCSREFIAVAELSFRDLLDERKSSVVGTIEGLGVAFDPH